MRTTLSIDDDILTAARQLASLRGVSVGSVISQLARTTLMSSGEQSSSRNGITLLPISPGAKGATLEEVNRLRDEAS